MPLKKEYVTLKGRYSYIMSSPIGANETKASLHAFFARGKPTIVAQKIDAQIIKSIAFTKPKRKKLYKTFRIGCFLKFV